MARDWSQYIVKDEEPKKDWSQFLVDQNNDGGQPSTPSNNESALFNALKSIGKGALSTGLGGAQSLGSSFASVVNAFPNTTPGPLGAFSDTELAEMPQQKIPHPNLQQFVPEGGANEALFHAAKFAGDIYGISKFDKIRKALGLFGGLGSSKLGEIGGNALSGFLTGEEGLGGRTGSAALGGAIGAIPAIPGAIKGTKQAIKDKLIFPKLGKSKKIYKDIEKSLTSAGKHTDLGVPKLDWKALGKEIPLSGDSRLPGLGKIKELTNEGTYKSLNEAQSAFSAYERELAKKSKMGGDVTAARNLIKNAEKKIHGKLFEKFMEVDPRLASKYQNANELFAQGKSSEEAFKQFLKDNGLKLSVAGGLGAIGGSLLGGKK